MNFSDVALDFNGNQYTVAGADILPLIARIEGVITLGELVDHTRPSNAKLAMAYGQALRFAGAQVTDQELYLCIFQEGAAQKMAGAVSGLLALMIPPEALQQKVGGDTKKPPARSRKRSSL